VSVMSGFWAAVLKFVEGFVSLWIARRQGRKEGLSEAALDAAEASLDTIKEAKEVSDEVKSSDDAELQRRAGKWVRGRKGKPD